MAGADFDAIVRAVVRELGGAGAEGAGSFVQGPPGPNGGTAMAGHLPLLGFDVPVFSIYGRELEALEARGGAELIGEEVRGFAKYSRITRSIDQAVQGADLIMP